MDFKNFFNHLTIIELIILLLGTSSCSAKDKNTNKDLMPMEQSKETLQKAIGDSISNIILKARHVEISTDSCPAKKLNADERAVVRYLIADTCNLSSDMKVFGEFIPYLYIKFKNYKRSVVVLYDFRLHKWMMKGENEKLLCMYDLKSNDILRFALLALPSDKYLNEFQKQQTK